MNNPEEKWTNWTTGVRKLLPLSIVYYIQTNTFSTPLSSSYIHNHGWSCQTCWNDLSIYWFNGSYVHTYIFLIRDDDQSTKNPAISLVAYNVTRLLIGPSTSPPITLTMYHVGGGARLFPVMGNGHGRVTEPKGDHLTGGNLGMIPYLSSLVSFVWIVLIRFVGYCRDVTHIYPKKRIKKQYVYMASGG